MGSRSNPLVCLGVARRLSRSAGVSAVGWSVPSMWGELIDGLNGVPAADWLFDDYLGQAVGALKNRLPHSAHSQRCPPAFLVSSIGYVPTLRHRGHVGGIRSQ